MDDSKRVITLKDFYRLSERRHRISVDIDSVKEKDNLKPQKVFFELKYVFPQCKVTMDRTRHGFHVKAVGDSIEKIPVETRIDLREKLGDDPRRIDYDRYKLEIGAPYLIDTLFSMKCDYDGTLSIVEPCNPVALPWFSRSPSRKVI